MRKLFLFDLISLDGFFASKDGGLEWHNVDDEFNQFAIAQLREIGTLVFGRKTYELMYDYWPSALIDPKTSHDDLLVAHAMNDIPKIVFSRTLEQVAWANTTLLRDDAEHEIKKLKKQDGKDIAIFGSANLASSIFKEIDEFRILVNPIVLGEGRPLFPALKKPLKLNLVNARQFKNGNVLLTYQHAK